MSRASSPLLLSRNILLLKISAGQNTGSDRQVSRRKPERYAASELRLLLPRGEVAFCLTSGATSRRSRSEALCRTLQPEQERGMKLGIIRCMQTEDYCPGTTDFAFTGKKGSV